MKVKKIPPQSVVAEEYNIGNGPANMSQTNGMMIISWAYRWSKFKNAVLSAVDNELSKPWAWSLVHMQALISASLWTSFASYSVWVAWSGATYEADGTADEETIQDAIDAVNAAWWWTVLVLPWDYTTLATNYIKDNVHLILSPWAIIHAMTDDHMITTLWATSKFSISGWKFDHWWSSAWSNHCIRIDQWSDFFIYNVENIDAWHHSFWIRNCDRYVISQCYSNGAWIAWYDWCWIVMEIANDWMIINNTTYNSWYHWIQCRWTCNRMYIAWNNVNDTWNVNAAWSWIQCQHTNTDIIITGNTLRNVSSAWISIEDTTWYVISDNIVDSTTTTAGIYALSSSLNGVVKGNILKWVSNWIKVADCSNISISGNIWDSITANGVYILWSTTNYNVTWNTFTWMAWWTTVWLLVEWTANWGVMNNNFVQWSRYLIRLNAWVDNILALGNMWKVTNLSSAVRDDSWWSNITLTSNATYL